MPNPTKLSKNNYSEIARVAGIHESTARHRYKRYLAGKISYDELFYPAKTIPHRQERKKPTLLRKPRKEPVKLSEIFFLGARYKRNNKGIFYFDVYADCWRKANLESRLKKELTALLAAGA